MHPRYEFTTVDWLVATVEGLDRFVSSALWYSRQNRVRRNLVRHPLYVWRDIWRRSMAWGRQRVAWERMASGDKVLDLLREVTDLLARVEAAPKATAP